ncbi:MAG: DUF86 domain-containing protein [Spirochaetales bacterium]|nr:DUF86 domain-containing protein [Spirochaetales bacterium]MBR6061867.1 DUF86 domain-containing protein [Spirochaetales bacterium]MBR6200801.1 DUF86 domain-containing protein [Spirochaetales bacterium]
MNRSTLNNKIESVLRCLNRIESQNVQNQNDLVDNYDKQDIVMLNLERAIQLCADIAAHILADHADTISPTMAAAFSNLAKLNIIPQDLSLRLSKAVGFRNLAVHQYKEIDYSIVYGILQNCLIDIKHFIKIISQL